jgi:magnesium transporter
MIFLMQEKKASLKSLVRELTYKPKERAALFESLPPEQQSQVLLRLSKYVQAQLVGSLKKEVILPILEHLDPDDTIDIMQILPKRKQKELLSEMTEGLQNTLSVLLQFDPKTAAGLMSLNYIQVDSKEKFKDFADSINIHEKRTGKLPVILVLEEGKLIGFLPIKNLIFAKPDDEAKKFIKKIATIRHNASSEAVINKIMDNPHQKISVLNENGTIMGIIYSDDVLRLLQEREASNLYDFAGVNNEETVFGSTKQKVKFRYKWLIVNLGTAFLAAAVVGLFNDTISKHILLAVYMPIIAGMGGNSATQTLAVLVRGIALKQVELSTALPILKKELGAALVNGAIIGFLVGTIIWIFNRDLNIALIMSAAMIVNLLVASFFGTLIPLIISKLKRDPATSATVFITTATDVLGFLFFLGLASLILS